MRLEDLIKLNPKLILKKGVPAPFIEMAALPTNEKFIHEIGQRKAIGSGAKFQNGDTLFARITPCLENGKGGYVSGLPDEVVGQGSTEFIVMRARKKSDEQFAYYLSRFGKFRNFAEKGMEGTSGRQRVTWQTLADFELPDLSEMQRAVLGDVLGSLDDKIELNWRMNETLEEMARALFRDWFIDFGPIRRQMDGATDPAAIMGHAFPDNKAAALAPLFPARLGDNGAPDGWGLRNLKSLGHIITGKTPSTKESKYYGSDVPFLKIPDMHGKIYVLETGTMLSSEGAASQEKKTLPKGSVSVSCIATPGLVVLNHRETQTNQQINSIVPFVDKHRYFLFWSCRELAAEVMVRGSGGSVFHNMNKTTFENLDVRFPGDKLASMLRSAVEPLHMKILVNEEENQTLAEIRDLLLPKLMSGEIQLKDSPMVQDTLDGQLIESS